MLVRVHTRTYIHTELAHQSYVTFTVGDERRVCVCDLKVFVRENEALSLPERRLDRRKRKEHRGVCRCASLTGC